MHEDPALRPTSRASARAVDGESCDADPASWYVYVLVSERATRTYVGITTDPDRRLAQHNGERTGGARSTRAGRPWRRGALHGPFDTRGEAQRIERALKNRRGPARLEPLDP